MKNVDNSNAIVDMWLAFMYDGSNYTHMGGNTKIPWTPYLAGSNITSHACVNPEKEERRTLSRLLV